MIMTFASPLAARNGGLRRKIRYAVVGLGYISQIAVLPAFAHARRNSGLTALISGDPLKLKKLGRKYGVRNLFVYEEYEIALRSGLFDAVYIALPNSMHAQYAIAAMEAGIHVLCEKPMASNSRECEAMNVVARAQKTKLMIAYRLHFEAANLGAMEIAREGRLGDLRFFSSTFSMNVIAGDIRLKSELAGGPVHDIGIYCINAARNLFRDEPTEVTAQAISCDDRRFREVPEMVCATLQFPRNRVATFLCGFNAAKVSEYRIVGTRGELLVDPAYELADTLKHRLTIGDRVKSRSFPKRDQFAPLLEHFSECIIEDREPGPSGLEGLADMRVIDAISLSIQTGKPQPIRTLPPPRRPTAAQESRKKPVKKPELIAASAPNLH